MSEELLYELRQDVTMPGHYWRAGIKKTKKEWMNLFNINSFQFGWATEWFIDLSPKDAEEVDRVKQIVKEEFNRQNLISITYTEAAENCVRKALTEFCKNEKK